jgi:hypothetical protein
MKKILLIAAVCAAMLVGSSKADVVVGWNFNDGRTPGGAGNFGPSPHAAGEILANVTSVGLTRNHDLLLTGQGAANAWGANNFSNDSNFDAAINAGNFFTFSVTPDAGFLLSLSSIGNYNIRRSGTGPNTGRWQYQVGSGSFVDLTSDITWGAITTVAGNPQASIDLTGITALQNASDAITFRLTVWGATTTGGTFYLNQFAGTTNNDFILNGSVSAIPEPTAVLLLTGMAGLVGLKRRRV